jgi:uncharacterized SAM-binding protein YcdF (DUF218 family)
VSDRPLKPRRRFRQIAWLLTALCTLLLVCYVYRAPLLIGVAQAWVVNEPTTNADAIVVLGGGLENRPFAAAELFHNGAAPRILYMNVRLSPAEEIGLTVTEKEQTHRILLSKGVPDAAITMIGNSVGSTYDESKAVESWMERSGAKSIIIPTDVFHTRRVRWIFGRELRNIKAEIHVVAINPLRYKTDDWWKHEEGVIAFQNEIIKFLYYRLKY